MSLSCPGEGILRRLGTDELDAAAYAAIEQHVEGCAPCTAILERLARGRRHAPLVLPNPERSPRIPGFAIRRELGRGAMGVVYLAIRTGGLDRPVALKVLPSAVGAEESSGARRRWLREARAVARIRHPNVVTLYDYGEADGWFYLVLEYVPGRTLKQRLAEPLPPREAAGLAETVARAVGCFHGRGLLHLDLKPSNILLDGEEEAPWERVVPKVSDFGLAVCDGDAGPAETTLAGIRGTPAYMAPEQAAASRGRIGAATDIHALGALLYELMTGRPPFQGPSTLETLDQVRGQEPVPPRRLNPKIPRDLETITLKCLEKEPARRYASAEALAGDLRRWLDGLPITARPVSFLEKTWRWCRRRPVVAALTASLALTFVISFLTVFRLWRHAETEHKRAEADFQTTIEVLGQLIDPIVPSETSHIVTPGERIATLRQTRESLLALARRRPDQRVIPRKLGYVDRALGFALMEEGSLGEARVYFEESLSCGERILRNDPLDQVALRAQAYTFLGFALLADRQDRPEESLRHLRRAVDVSAKLMRILPDANSISLLAESRGRLATLLARRADASLWSKLASSEANRLPARDWAERAAQAIRATAHAGLGSAQECQVGSRLVDFMYKLAVDQRHRGNLGAAGRTADRMFAFARLLVARHPDQPAAHLALSQAHSQFYKNAWRVEDRVAVERYLRLALGAALRAQTLDPSSELTLSTVDRLQGRLEDLLHPR